LQVLRGFFSKLCRVICRIYEGENSIITYTDKLIWRRYMKTDMDEVYYVDTLIIIIDDPCT